MKEEWEPCRKDLAFMRFERKHPQLSPIEVRDAFCERASKVFGVSPRYVRERVSYNDKRWDNICPEQTARRATA